MLEECRSLIEAGGTIVFLRPRTKRPFENDWPRLPRLTWEQAREQLPLNANIGIRLGEPSRLTNGFYLHSLDCDIRDLSSKDDALTALNDLIGNLDRFPMVISGSGGESRHIYFTCNIPLQTRKLAHSAEKIKDSFGKQHWKWEIDLGGTGKQFALPPSIHPDTHRPYMWATGSAPNWLRLPLIPSVLALDWAASESPSAPSDDLEAFSRQVRAATPTFSLQEINETLDLLAADDASRNEWIEDREGWLKLGFALHHQFDGDEDGFEIWCEYSAQSGKFDPDDSRRVWDSMGRDRRAPPVTFRTLYARAKTLRLADKYGFVPDESSLGRIDETLDGLDAEFDKAIREIEQQKEREFSSWVHELDRGDDDTLKATVPNIALILAREPRLRGLIGQNEFTHEIVQRRPLSVLVPTMFPMPLCDPVSGDLWEDSHDANLMLFLSTAPNGRRGGYGFNPSDRNLQTAVISAARYNAFHPVRDFLRSEPWDGTPRAETLFIDYLGCPDRPYFRETARLLLVAAVARIFEPGHKFDFAAILEGLQGKRKSTFISILGGPWYSTLSGDLGDRKMMVEQMQGCWIVELPDLSGMDRSGVNDIKAFMSDAADRVRLAYARRAGRFSRQCVFVGTSNDRHYLRDETGNRRFFPIPVSVQMIDTDRLQANIRQIWAEALSIYRRMRAVMPSGRLPLYLGTAAAADEAFSLQADRKAESPVEMQAGQVREWLNTPRNLSEIIGRSADNFGDSKTYLRTRTCVAEVWREVFGNQKPPTSAESQILSRALHSLAGWSAGRASYRTYGQQRGIVRDGASEEAIRAGYTEA